MAKFAATFILPDIGSPDDKRVTLESLNPLRYEVQLLLTGQRPEDLKLPNFQILWDTEAATPGQLINLALPAIEGEFVALLSSGVEVSSDLLTILAKYRQKINASNHLYGNYLQRNENSETSIIEVNPCPDDITEREDWGLLEFYRTDALRDLGGCDPLIRFRHDYDLRLRLTVDNPSCRIAEILGTAPYIKPDKDPGVETLYFPGRGKLGGFSYLFLDPDEEKEIEEIFYRFLKLNNAFLNEPPGGVFPKPGGASPRVSVVIPVHNRADFLPLAVASVQRGTFEDFEIIIVDNASSDSTLEVAQKLARQDQRIKAVSLTDNVIAKALNTGIQYARGDYIAQLDSDDEYTSDTLEVMVRTLDENLDWALAISYYDLMDESGNILKEFGIIEHLEYNRNNILRVDGAGALRCWRKAAIEQMGGFNETNFGHYGEDYDLVLKAGEKWELGRVHQVLYHYRRHPGNSDVLRAHEMKIKNKTLARRRAIKRRQKLNQNR